MVSLMLAWKCSLSSQIIQNLSSRQLQKMSSLIIQNLRTYTLNRRSLNRFKSHIVVYLLNSGVLFFGSTFDKSNICVIHIKWNVNISNSNILSTILWQFLVSVPCRRAVHPEFPLNSYIFKLVRSCDCHLLRLCFAVVIIECCVVCAAYAASPVIRSNAAALPDPGPMLSSPVVKQRSHVSRGIFKLRSFCPEGDWSVGVVDQNTWCVLACWWVVEKTGRRRVES